MIRNLRIRIRKPIYKYTAVCLRILLDETIVHTFHIQLNYVFRIDKSLT